MMLPFFPFRKIRRNWKWLFIGALFIVLTFLAYLEFGRIDDLNQKGQTLCLHQDIKSDLRGEVKIHIQDVHIGHIAKDYGRDSTWTSKYIYQPWKPEYKGQVNLHVFEDWCGSSIAKLRANIHYPLYAHSRSTLKKLAVSPRWSNYGLRIFGYIHPSTDGEFIFAVASDDNCEFWLSMDENPDRLQILAYVGKSGKEWTAPGEYMKFASQISQPVLLQQQKRYYFELVHKQNTEGTDHVEVAWRLNKAGTKFEIIDSEFLSLYTNESAFKMSDVSHIPQTSASHVAPPQEIGDSSAHDADILREDPRDTFYQIPLLGRSYLWAVLPECVYKPSYIIKDFPLFRYQGLQFVRLTYVYPNDHTRLTHMESENKCFYQMTGLYLQSYGFSRYMILDRPEKDAALPYRDGSWLRWREGQVWKDYARMEQEGEEEAEALGVGGQLGYMEDYNDYVLRGQRGLLSDSLTKGKRGRRRMKPDVTRAARPELKSQTLTPTAGKPADRLGDAQNVTAPPADPLDRVKEEPVDPAELAHRPKSTVHWDQQSKDKPKKPPALGQDKPKEVAVRDVARLKNGDSAVFVKGRSTHVASNKELNDKLYFRGHEGKVARGVASAEEVVRVAKDKVASAVSTDAAAMEVTKGRVTFDHVGLQKAKNDSIMPKNRLEHQPQRYGSIRDADDPVKRSNQAKFTHGYALGAIPPPIEKQNRAWEKGGGPEAEQEQEMANAMDERRWRPSIEQGEDNIMDRWKLYEDSDADDDLVGWVATDPEVNWAQTFQVNQHNFQTLRSDWIDLNCNVSGNLLIEETEAVAVVEAFMEKLNQKHLNTFSLQRIVNVEKRLDIARGSRYLLELDLLYRLQQRVRLAHYVYVPQSFSARRDLPVANPPLTLCWPRGLKWNPKATVYFIVPVKNQARWVQQFIVDMEKLYQATGDENFRIIITDYSSTDMDVEQALKSSRLPNTKFQYVRLNGNFQRSAGLQAGIDLITEEHSILFLCDLHIHFPLGFIDSVRRHCVEGRMAFAPIVMRLNCGATPWEPDGYWEVNGFGLLGIYKSDLDSIGGMNTRDFTDRWGGEDWELLDRILQAGLEVERIYLRNFFHYYHSKRGMWNRQTIRSM